MKKAFLLMKKNERFCSLCGEECTARIHKKHLFVNELEPIKEEDILYYTVKDDKDRIQVDIHNKDQIVFSVSFNGKGILESSGEEGWPFWQDMMKQNFLYKNYRRTPRFLSFTEDECQIVSHYFPSVYKVDNMGYFIEAVSKKSIKEKQIDTSWFNKIPYGKVNLFVGNKYNGKKVKLCKMKEYKVQNNDVIFEVIYVTGTVFESKITDPNKYRFFISKDFIYNPKGYDLYELIGKPSDGESQIYERCLFTEFQNAYPEVKLKEFVESGGTDIVRFILSNNNDPIFEIIGKAGLGYIAEASDEMDIDKSGKNIKDFFTMPIKAVRSLNSKAGAGFLVKHKDTAAEIYKKMPAIFEKRITDSGIRFLIDMKAYQNSLGKDILKCFRFANRLSTEDYELYMDYLRMCHIHHVYPLGKFPGQLKTAHDVMIVYGAQQREALKTVGFELAINHLEYQNLKYDTADFKFLIPRNADDLVNESYQMRNCVRSYVASVCNRYTYIVFLRRKKSLATSFVTIEVTNDYILRQVKGKGNSMVSREIAELVIEWCIEKGISYKNCYDLREVLE